jgi:hypothetical protein
MKLGMRTGLLRRGYVDLVERLVHHGGKIGVIHLSKRGNPVEIKTGSPVETLEVHHLRSAMDERSTIPRLGEDQKMDE